MYAGLSTGFGMLNNWVNDSEDDEDDYGDESDENNKSQDSPFKNLTKKLICLNDL